MRRPLEDAGSAGRIRAAAGQKIPKAGKASTMNTRPVIGILSQPGSPAPEDMSYIAASYVKWVEAAGARVVPILFDMTDDVIKAAGARVVPILFDMTDDEIKARFKAVNAVLLPGGGAKLSPGHRFYDVARLLVDLAIAANDRGDYFPVHGTCLGMETLAIITSTNYTILTNFDAEDAAAPLLLTPEAAKSHLFQSLPEDVVKDLQLLPIAMENHMKGLSLSSYTADKKLSAFFNVISLSVDKSGEPYVSTLESPSYPITATQWHPEKNAFEWATNLNIPHSPEAEVGNFFATEARKNQHKSDTLKEEQDMLIYNWEPLYTGKDHGDGEETDFEQAYFFDKSSA
eukprot:gene16022-22160_t